MEAVVAMAVILKQYDFELVPNQVIGMTTGATIHTTNGLYMYVRERAATAGKVEATAAGSAAVATA